METKPEVCRTTLISDEPATDNRVTGAHSNVADALVEMVNSEEIGGKAIALEGSWGAGKSTVIQLFKKKIEHLKKGKGKPVFSVFIFDAWAHEGDPLRRTFLEKCIVHVLSLGWVKNTTDWEDQLLAIQGKVKRTDTTTTPHFGWLGFFIALLALLGPVAMALINKGISEGSPFYTDRNFLIGALVYVFLVLLVLIVAKLKGFDAISVVIHKFENESKTITIENPDPTSVEFEEIFLNLLGDITEKNKQNKLVLVLDNLDRVEPEDALSILSTLQTYIQNPLESSNELSKNVWVIIPYDPSGLNNIWRAKSGGTDSNVIAQSMIEKRFSVRFRVPPLVLSDWKEYLLELLERAFPNHEQSHESEFDLVYAVYWTFWHSVRKSTFFPTPRELIVFVNQVGAIHRQWCGKIPLHHMAYFVLLILQKPLREFEPELESGAIVYAELEKLLDKEEVINNLASIWFNVEPGFSQELLLLRPLTTALSTANIDAFNSLAENHPGLKNVLENLDFDSLANAGDFEPLSNAVTAIAGSTFFGDRPKLNQLEQSRLIDKMYEAVVTVVHWDGFDANIGKGVGQLVKLTRNTQIARTVLARISENPKDGFAYSQGTIDHWCDGVSAIYTEAKQIDSGFRLTELKMPTDVDGYLAALFEFYENPFARELWEAMTPPVAPETIVNRMVQLLEDNEQALVNGQSIRAIDTIQKAKPGTFPLEDLVTQISTKLRDGALEDLTVINNLYDWLEVFMGSSLAPPDTIGTVVDSGYSYHHFYLAHKKADAVSAGKFLFKIIKTRPETPPPPDVPNSAAGYSALKELWQNPTENQTDVSNAVVKLLVDYEDQDLLFEVLGKNVDASKWACLCLQEIVSSEYPVEFGIEKLQLHWKALRKHLGHTAFIEFVNEDSIRDPIVSHINGSGFSLKHAGLYRALIEGESEESDSSKLVSWLTENLEKLSVQDWVVNLENETELVDFVLILVNSKYVFDLDLKFADALVAHIKNALVNSKFPDRLGTSWAQLPQALREPHKRLEFRRKLLTCAEEHTSENAGRIPQQFFDIFGPELMDESILLENDKLFSHFVTPMLSATNDAGIAWFNGLLNKVPRFFKMYRENSPDQNDAKVFLDRLKIQHEDPQTSEKNKSVLEEIAEKVGLSLVQPTPNDGESTETTDSTSTA